MREVITKRPYKHFKGNLYYVHDILQDTENEEMRIVSYQALYPPYGMYAREVGMFLEEVEKGRIDNITGQNYRFELFDSSKWFEVGEKYE